MPAKRATVVPFQIGFSWETGAPEPILVQSPDLAFLVFHAVGKTKDGGRIDAPGVVELVDCKITKFGYPNDEALPGHPLFRFGLSNYAVFEVIGSSWIQEMAEQNRVAFPHSDHSSGRHFVSTFTDETFECVCEDLRASLSTKSWNGTLRDVTERILSRS